MEQKLYLQNRKLEDSHWWFVGRRRIIRQVLTSLNVPRKMQILEVGCGTGGNLGLLSEFGEVIGVEPEFEAAKMARARNICEVCVGGFPDDLPFTGQQFDVIILLDVLEHLDDDLSALKALRSLLSREGNLILTVPAFQFLWTVRDEQHHHRRRYGASHLSSLIWQAGFRIMHLTYFNFWLFPIEAVRRLIRKLVPSDVVGYDLRVHGVVINRLLEAVFASERYLVTHMRIPYGLSLLAIIKK